MSISQTTTLSKPIGDEEVPFDTFVYFRARAKRFAYELAIKEFQKSKLTKAQLARRLGKGADRVSKMLAGPGNWTMETLADLLFATSGGVPTFNVDHPLDRAARNFRQPDWLEYKRQTTESANGAFFNLRFGEPPPVLQTN